MTTIWIDLTTTRDWQRAPVGVVRVEQSIARWFLEERGHETRFCAYERDAGRFVEISREQVIAWLEPPPATSTFPATIPPGLESRLARKAKGALESAQSRVPALRNLRLQRRLKPAKRVLDAVIRTARVARDHGRSIKKAERDIPRPIQAIRKLQSPFAAGDVYLSVGLDWDKKDLPELLELKRERGLIIAWFCHDLIPILRPHLTLAHVAARFRTYFLEVAELADVVFCNSERTRLDLEGFLAQEKARIPDTRVVRLGCDIHAPDEQIEREDLRTIVDGGDFIMCVSTIERRKNHETLCWAYARLREQGVNVPKLVFVGMPGWGVAGVLDDLHFDPRLKGMVVTVDHVTDGELAALYRRCLFTVYPSWYEGWGLPVAESLAYGKHCICSSAASLPEVGGDLVEYVDPMDTLGWAEAIKRNIEDPKRIRASEKRIAAQFKIDRWRDTATTIARDLDARRSER